MARDADRPGLAESIGSPPPLEHAPNRPPRPGAKVTPFLPAPAPAPVAPTRKKARRKPPWQRVLTLGLLLAALGVGGHYAYGWWTDGRFLVGTDDAYVRADITQLAAKVAGYVASVEVRDNQPVAAGQVIARIDDGDYRLDLQAAQDKLATQQATIARMGRQIDAAAADVAKAEADLGAAQADAVRAAADFVRQQQLSRADFASRATLDQAQADRDRSAAAVRSAEAALTAQRARIEVLGAQRVEAERLASELATALARAERDLSFTVVRAPLDGVVGNKAVQVGSYVEPGTRLAALVPLDQVHVDANFKETQLAHIRPGQEVRLSVDAYDDDVIRGTVESVAPASGAVFSLLPPENATGNFTKIVQRVPVRIKVPVEVVQRGILRPGLSVVARVDTRTGPPEPTLASR